MVSGIQGQVCVVVENVRPEVPTTARVFELCGCRNQSIVIDRLKGMCTIELGVTSGNGSGAAVAFDLNVRAGQSPPDLLSRTLRGLPSECMND